MRIFSKFSDYYDAAMAYGQDKSLVFTREHAEWEVHPRIPAPKGFAEEVECLLPLLPGTRTISRLKGAFSEISLNPGLVVLAGKLYPYVAVVPYKHQVAQVFPWTYPVLANTLAQDGVKFFYDEASLQAHFLDLGHDLGMPSRNARRHGIEGVAWNHFFALKGDSRLLPLCIAKKLMILGMYHARQEFRFEVNPVLKNIEFYRCMDSWSVFQELSLFLGNLAQPDPATVVISEKEKLAKHGMDEWSFRKMPSA